MLTNVNGLPKWLLSEYKEVEVLDRLRDEMAREDSIMRNLYAGKWDPRLVTKDNVGTLFGDLTGLNLPAL